MIVTFTSQHSPDIVMFGDIAKKLLKMMGHSGTVPGAIRPGDLPEMLQKLKDGLARLSPEKEGSSPAPANSEGERSVPLSVRAGPLVALIETAIKNEDHVMWE